MSKLLSLILLLTAASCAHLEYGLFYVADTAKRSKCDAMTADKATIQEMLDPKAGISAEYEKQTGYSECTRSNNGTDYVVTECKKPVLYKTVLTTKQALCHQFMVENKLMENTTK